MTGSRSTRRTRTLTVQVSASEAPPGHFDRADLVLRNLPGHGVQAMGSIILQHATTTRTRRYKAYAFIRTCGSVIFVLASLELLLRFASIGPLRNPNPKHFAPSRSACVSELPYRQYSEGISL